MKKIFVVFVAVIVGCLSMAYGQVTSSASIKNSANAEYEDLVVTSDFDLSDSLYKNIWNNTQIRYADKITSKNDTVVVLFSENDRYQHPFSGKVISKYGRRGSRHHSGTDIKLQKGDSVWCAFDGKVRIAKRMNGYGNMVLVRHNNGLETIYAHLSSISVTTDEVVRAGSLIGLGGRTGRATTDHLHFETRLFGQAFDSSVYIDFEAGRLKVDKLFYNEGRVTTSKQELSATNMHRSQDLNQEAGQGVTHTIKQGDTLWNIAKRYGTTVARICSDNNILKSQVLKIGLQLKIQQ